MPDINIHSIVHSKCDLPNLRSLSNTEVTFWSTYPQAGCVVSIDRAESEYIVICNCSSRPCTLISQTIYIPCFSMPHNTLNHVKQIGQQWSQTTAMHHRTLTHWRPLSDQLYYCCLPRWQHQTQLQQRQCSWWQQTDLLQCIWYTGWVERTPHKMEVGYCMQHRRGHSPSYCESH